MQASEVNEPRSHDKRALCQVRFAYQRPGWSGFNASGVVLLAVTEDGLSTEARRGENAGERLRHTAVVRALREVATMRPGDAPPLSVKTTIELNPSWRLDRLKLAAFVQDPQSGKVLAAAQKLVAARPQQ
jgi:hypothetical protein